MKRETRNLLLIAVAAALVGGVAAFIVEGPGPLLRTEAGQRALNAVIQRDAPEGLAIAKRGEPMPRPQVWTLEGKRIDLPIAKGRPMLINVWATWCGPCIKEMPELSALAAMRQHIAVIGLAYEDTSEDELRAFLAKRPVAYPIARIDVYEPPKDFGAPRGLPTTWLIAPDGTMKRKYTGPVTARMLEDDIAAFGGPKPAAAEPAG